MKKEILDFNIYLYKTGNYNVFTIINGEKINVNIISTNGYNYPVIGIYKTELFHERAIVCHKDGTHVHVHQENNFVPISGNLHLESKRENPEKGDMITFICEDGVCYITNAYIVDKSNEVLEVKIGEESPCLVTTIPADYLSYRLSTEEEIEIFNRVTRKPKFEPFDKVLVRYGNSIWYCDFFCYIKDGYFNTSSRRNCKHCIPYNEETKHLIGTSDDCPKYDIPL